MLSQRDKNSKLSMKSGKLKREKRKKKLRKKLKHLKEMKKLLLLNKLNLNKCLLNILKNPKNKTSCLNLRNTSFVLILWVKIVVLVPKILFIWKIMLSSLLKVGKIWNTSYLVMILIVNLHI